jgi:hypothetical protein
VLLMKHETLKREKRNRKQQTYNAKQSMLRSFKWSEKTSTRRCFEKRSHSATLDPAQNDDGRKINGISKQARKQTLKVIIEPSKDLTVNFMTNWKKNIRGEKAIQSV